MASVLVVDDEVGILKLLEGVLGDEGHTVVIVANGRQALERAAERAFDLVIFDYMMPTMDGPELIEAMASQQALASTPTLLMSSLSEACILERIGGYTAFLRKPFKIFDLIDLVRDLVPGTSRVLARNQEI